MNVNTQWLHRKSFYLAVLKIQSTFYKKGWVADVMVDKLNLAFSLIRSSISLRDVRGFYYSKPWWRNLFFGILSLHLLLPYKLFSQPSSFILNEKNCLHRRKIILTNDKATDDNKVWFQFLYVNDVKVEKSLFTPSFAMLMHVHDALLNFSHFIMEAFIYSNSIHCG